MAVLKVERNQLRQLVQDMASCLQRFHTVFFPEEPDFSKPLHEIGEQFEGANVYRVAVWIESISIRGPWREDRETAERDLPALRRAVWHLAKALEEAE